MDLPSAQIEEGEEVQVHCGEKNKNKMKRNSKLNLIFRTRYSFFTHFQNVKSTTARNMFFVEWSTREGT